MHTKRKLSEINEPSNHQKRTKKQQLEGRKTAFQKLSEYYDINQVIPIGNVKLEVIFELNSTQEQNSQKEESIIQISNLLQTYKEDLEKYDDSHIIDKVDSLLSMIQKDLTFEEKQPKTSYLSVWKTTLLNFFKLVPKDSWLMTIWENQFDTPDEMGNSINRSKLESQSIYNRDNYFMVNGKYDFRAVVKQKRRQNSKRKDNKTYIPMVGFNKDLNMQIPPSMYYSWYQRQKFKQESYFNIRREDPIKFYPLNRNEHSISSSTKLQKDGILFKHFSIINSEAKKIVKCCLFHDPNQLQLERSQNYAETRYLYVNLSRFYTTFQTEGEFVIHNKFIECFLSLMQHEEMSPISKGDKEDLISKKLIETLENYSEECLISCYQLMSYLGMFPNYNSST